MTSTLVYDHSFEGFLSAVFYSYEYKCVDTIIRREKLAAPTFFGTTECIPTNHAHANRVWKGIERYASKKGARNVFKAFLSEGEMVEDLLFYFIRRTFQQKKNIYTDFSDPRILAISKIVKSVDREKHRMDAFIRFRLTKDDIYFATIAPDFNVLPLNKKHFENRYADQKWLIYDVKRNYGLYYDLKEVTTIKLSLERNIVASKASEIFFTEKELQFQDLWKNYFKSTTIASRKNNKLHLQHVPKRYWKYLSEKSPLIKN